MVEDRLAKYVTKYLSKGYSLNALFEHLLSQGWSSEEIREAFLVAESQSIFLYGKPGFPKSQGTSKKTINHEVSKNIKKGFLSRVRWKRFLVISLVVLVLVVVLLFFWLVFS